MKRNALVILALTCVVAFTVMAQPPGPRRHMPKQGPPHAAMLKELNLTEAQDAQVQKNRIDLMKKQTQLRAKVQTLRLDTKELFLAEKPDRSAIEKNVKAISDAQEQMKLAMLDHWFAVNALLTPEQQKVWKKHALQMGNAMRERAKGMGQMLMQERFDEGEEAD